MKRTGKRINWTPIALTCLGLGAATGGLALALTQSADPTPATARSRALGESLSAANERLNPPEVVTATLRPREVSQRSGSAGDNGAGAPVARERRQDEVDRVTRSDPIEPSEAVVVPLVVAPSEVTDADTGLQSDAGSLDAGAPAAPDVTTTTDAAAAPVAPAAEADAATEPGFDEDLPPGADLGVTYCSISTCNVGFKCCCDRCTPFDEPCYAPECEAYTGLSVSVSCGMDICEPGEICCDPTCAACSESGRCPERPCD